MWEDLKNNVQKRIETLLQPNIKEKRKEPTVKKICFESGCIVQAAIDLASVFFQENLTVTEGLKSMIVFLDRILPEIPPEEDNFKNNIAFICELLFSREYYSCSNTLYYLMRRVLVNQKEKDVRRVRFLRSLIPRIDQEQNVEHVLTLYAECAVSSLYLSMEQVILTSLEQAATYGKAYMSAWSHAVKYKRDPSNVFQYSYIMDLMLHAVEDREMSVVHNIREVLLQFNSFEFRMKKMIYESFMTIALRYMKHPKSYMRANTARIFLDRFPILDPSIQMPETVHPQVIDQVLNIKDFLRDENNVREATIIGLHKIMSTNVRIFSED
ncbi:condensin-2 complex subunit G2, partial [Nephila pilipes]